MIKLFMSFLLILVLPGCIVQDAETDQLHLTGSTIHKMDAYRYQPLTQVPQLAEK